MSTQYILTNLPVNMKSPGRNKGVILIVALVMLLVMTSLGVTTMSGSVLQERIASNHRQQYMARANAEAALKAAENYLNGLVTRADGLLSINEINATFGVVDINGDPPTGFYTRKVLNGNGPFDTFVNLDQAASWVGNGIEVSRVVGDDFYIGLANAGVVANPPKIIIEYLGCEEPNNCADEDDSYYSFRIVAIGWAEDSNAYSILQAIYLSRQP